VKASTGVKHPLCSAERIVELTSFEHCHTPQEGQEPVLRSLGLPCQEARCPWPSQTPHSWPRNSPLTAIA
jgi:hypothetical protein